VIIATDGLSGLAKVREEKPDLVLMDVSIPKMDGWTVTRTLKADPATSGIPIIILTAHALAGDRKTAYETGANGYISKPANPVAVADAVARTLEQPAYAVGFENKPL
jgi:two-component system cell cycle response regulator DivK